MSHTQFFVTPLKPTYDRKTFSCGSELLDRYLQKQVTQDERRLITACFCALTGSQRIAGYYTLASASLFLAELPENITKKLPRYPSVPTVRMGRLAVDQAFKGQGLGSSLLADAIDRAIRSEIAAFALMVDAKDESAAAFYKHHGFIVLPKSPMTLFIPLAAARKFVGSLLYS
jgi:ribosomal protein S18 acetylase RimI-like enzyme